MDAKLEKKSSDHVIDVTKTTTSLHATHELVNLLENSKKSSESLLYYLPTLILIIDKKGRILKANQMVEKIANISSHEILNFPLSRIFSNKNWSIFHKKIFRIYTAENDDQEFEFDLATDGLDISVQYIHWKIRKMPGLENPDKTLISVTGHNITRIKKMLREIQESHEKLSCYSVELAQLLGVVENQKKYMLENSKMAQLGEMAGGIAQEIGQPMSVLRDYAGRMRQEVEESKEKKDGNFDMGIVASSVTIIQETINNIAKIIEIMRYQSRSGIGDPFENHDLVQIVEDSTIYFKEKFRHKSIKLEIHGKKKENVIECQSVNISQVIINLLNNCHVALQNLDEKWVRIEINDYDEDYVEILVHDSGPGIDSEKRDLIFKPFYTNWAAYPALGVGLSTCKQILGEHKGSISLSTKFKNTCFSIILPKKQ